MQLKGKVALVTGASGGFGQAVTDRFSIEGATVIAADIRLSDSNGKNVHPVKLDVTNEQGWQQTIKDVMTQWERIDILVNNAGIISHDPLIDQSAEGWEKMIAVNQTGVFLGMKHILPGMLAQGSGNIVNISSTLGQVAVKGAFAYHATKAAVLAMTKNAAITHAQDGVRVNAVLPGIADTPMVHNQPKDFTAAAIAAHPMNRLSKPSEIASAILFLASDESSAITGVGLPVDGGYLAQ